MAEANYIKRGECVSTHKTLMEKIDTISEDVKDIAVELARLPENMANKFDERYADKKTERTVDRILWLVISAVILAGLALIFK